MAKACPDHGLRVDKKATTHAASGTTRAETSLLPWRNNHTLRASSPSTKQRVRDRVLCESTQYEGGPVLSSPCRSSFAKVLLVV